MTFQENRQGEFVKPQESNLVMILVIFPNGEFGSEIKIMKVLGIQPNLKYAEVPFKLDKAEFEFVKNSNFLRNYHFIQKIKSSKYN